jgi:hypothetical protein
MDGINLIPFVTGKMQGHPHDALFWRSGPYQTLLAGDWKLQVSDNPKRNWLFNLKDDPTEQRNLVDRDADRLNAQLAQLALGDGSGTRFDHWSIRRSGDFTHLRLHDRRRENRGRPPAYPASGEPTCQENDQRCR